MAVVNTRPQAVLSHCKGDTSEPVVEHAIGDALRLAAQKRGGRIALVDGSPTANPRRRWTFEQLLEDGEQVARALLGRFAPGDHVAIWSPNCPEVLNGYFSTAQAVLICAGITGLAIAA